MILSCTAGVPNLSAQNGEVSFSGRQQGQFGFTPTTLTAGPKIVEITASGPATHLGNSQTVIRGDVDLDENLTPTPQPPGSWTLTAANGDKLIGTFTWRGTPTVEFGIFTLTGTYRITSGTGRFTNATGTGTGTGHLNCITGVTTYTWNGTLLPRGPR